MKHKLLILFFLLTLAAFAQPQQILVFTIPAGGSITQGLETKGCTPAVIETPATFTGTTLSFQGLSYDGSTWKEVFDQFNSAVSVSAGTSRMIQLSPADWWAFRALKIRSGTSGSPTTEAGARVLVIHCR